MKHRLFVYGTLRDPNILHLVLGHPYGGPRRLAVLHGFRRQGIAGYEFPAVVADQKGRVDGILMEGLTDEELAALDAYEDVSAGLYDRVEAEVTLDEAESDPCVKSYVYVAGRLLR